MRDTSSINSAGIYERIYFSSNCITGNLFVNLVICFHKCPRNVFITEPTSLRSALDLYEPKYFYCNSFDVHTSLVYKKYI